MSGKGRQEEGKEEVKGHEPQGLADLCQRMMAADTPEGCGSAMREMMSRCMAHFRGKQKQAR